MAIKKRSKVTDKQAQALADEIADKPYGSKKENDKMVNTSITLPQSLLIKLEDQAFANKRKGIEPKSVSAIIREAITNK
jgi:hypothetical protein